MPTESLNTWETPWQVELDYKEARNPHQLLSYPTLRTMADVPERPEFWLDIAKTCRKIFTMSDRKELTIAVRAIDKASGTLDKVDRKLRRRPPDCQINARLERTQRSLKKVTAGLDKASDALQTAGTAATVGLTVPISAFGAASIKSAADFEFAMTKVKTLPAASCLKI